VGRPVGGNDWFSRRPSPRPPRIYDFTGAIRFGEKSDVDQTIGPVAQWIRHRPTEPGIAGSSPAGVIVGSDEAREDCWLGQARWTAS
jgi:hypothetical protein